MNVLKLSRVSALSLIILPLINAAAFAQVQAEAHLTPNRMATNLAGATTAIAPPEYFDPLMATPEELATYGFPPRPDVGVEPKAYATWKRAMLASKTRIVPHLEQTNVFHGPRRNPDNTSESTGTSSNWSGVVDFSGAAWYNNTSTFYYILADYVVPVATQAYGICTGSWDYSSSWVGIDGDGSGDVLQAGSESDAYCNGSNKSSYYSAWYEWYPYGEVRISNLPVNPGDDIFVEVWHTSSTQGYAYMVNYNTNQWVDIGFTAPGGTSLIGNSAEWVVERPGVGGGLATLTNYISDYFSDAYAYTENYTQYTPGSYGALLLTMTDNNGYAISYPTLLGQTGIWFQDEGSAR